MSETVSPKLIGRRLDSVPNDMRDVRLRVIGLGDRMSGMEARLGGMDGRFSATEARLAGIEQRLGRVAVMLELMAQAKGLPEPQPGAS